MSELDGRVVAIARNQTSGVARRNKGARFDEHSFAGNEDSQRATLAYVFDDKTTKLKSSFGTGFRFPSLYETFYVFNSANNCAFGANAPISVDCPKPSAPFFSAI